MTVQLVRAMRRPALMSLALLVVALGIVRASAQDVVGRRQFSDQLVISEPFVEDELSLPSVLHIRRPAHGSEPGARSTRVEAEVKKRLTTSLEASVSGGFTYLDRERASGIAGLENAVIGLKYQLLRSEATETVMSLALDWEIGSTGRSKIGADTVDTLTPSLLLGKGLGDLPDALALARPFAMATLVQGILPTAASTRARGQTEAHPNSVRWGLVVEYSVPYLESFVRPLGIPAPLDGMVPIVEIEHEIALDRGARGRDIGTANPGVVWMGRALQIGVEGVIPLNARTGSSPGIRAFLRLGLDELLGDRFGEPLFGARR